MPGLPRNGDLIKKKGLESFPASMRGKNEACVVDRDTSRPPEGFQDMTDMKVLNDAEVAENLRLMYVNKKAYCRCGATLVAMNLNEPVKGVYEEATLQKYIKQDETGEHLPPHIWNTGYQRYKAQIFFVH